VAAEALRMAMNRCAFPLGPVPLPACLPVSLTAHSLGAFTGRVDVEDLLDIIFRDFCIGK
jgi:tRNA U34 5-carboxymethylaminomethyl modifying GTPase MnmE/TrmE